MTTPAYTRAQALPALLQQRIAILDGGRVREEGPREALAADPRSRFSELLRVGMEEVLV